ncbi:serine-rich adhesin for platelets [Austrofundulus limnaeus]|uniref:Serine-rich adhesin for platelets n=1 Tax=Austrofundulus limnaeus TaxID=52670 RepID=A0A2I4B3S6_AUSLI|nr:PREDICTED: protein FAM83G [Austrofundulus limnaeus]
MALSQIQCLDDNHVNPRTHESKPEFLYCEEQRLALEALLRDGGEAFVKYLEARGLRGFLSDLERDALKAAAEPFDPDKELLQQDADDERTPLSLQYWPELSDTSFPQMDLGWPACDSYRGVTRTSVYTQPPLDGQAHIKEVVRKMIAQAQKVIAVVMDVFTDVDIFRDLLDAGFKRKVSVYILLERTTLPHFLSMCQRASMHAGHLKHLRVCCTGGSEFYTRHCTKVVGRMGHRFMFIDGDKAVSGSYSFTWMSSRLDRNLVTVTTGQAVDAFDKLFRLLYMTSRAVDLRKVATEPEPEADARPQVASVIPPSAALARKLHNPKYALVALTNPCPTTSVGNENPKEPEISEKSKKKEQRRLSEDTPPLHPGLTNLEKADLIPYLPIWPEPDPPKDVIGFINIRDANKSTQVHLQRSERFETSQAIKFSSPLSNPQQPLPEVATPRQIANKHEEIDKLTPAQNETKTEVLVVDTAVPGHNKSEDKASEQTSPPCSQKSVPHEGKTSALKTEKKLHSNAAINPDAGHDRPDVSQGTSSQASNKTPSSNKEGPSNKAEIVSTISPKADLLALSPLNKPQEILPRQITVKHNEMTKLQPEQNGPKADVMLIDSPASGSNKIKDKVSEQTSPPCSQKSVPHEDKMKAVKTGKKLHSNSAINPDACHDKPDVNQGTSSQTTNKTLSSNKEGPSNKAEIVSTISPKADLLTLSPLNKSQEILPRQISVKHDEMTKLQPEQNGPKANEILIDSTASGSNKSKDKTAEQNACIQKSRIDKDTCTIPKLDKKPCLSSGINLDTVHDRPNIGSNTLPPSLPSSKLDTLTESELDPGAIKFCSPSSQPCETFSEVEVSKKINKIQPLQNELKAKELVMNTATPDQNQAKHKESGQKSPPCTQKLVSDKDETKILKTEDKLCPKQAINLSHDAHDLSPKILTQSSNKVPSSSKEKPSSKAEIDSTTSLKSDSDELKPKESVVDTGVPDHSKSKDKAQCVQKSVLDKDETKVLKTAKEQSSSTTMKPNAVQITPDTLIKSSNKARTVLTKSDSLTQSEPDLTSDLRGFISSHDANKPTPVHIQGTEKTQPVQNEPKAKELVIIAATPDPSKSKNKAPEQKLPLCSQKSVPDKGETKVLKMEKKISSNTATNTDGGHNISDLSSNTSPQPSLSCKESPSNKLITSSATSSQLDSNESKPFWWYHLVVDSAAPCQNKSKNKNADEKSCSEKFIPDQNKAKALKTENKLNSNSTIDPDVSHDASDFSPHSSNKTPLSSKQWPSNKAETVSKTSLKLDSLTKLTSEKETNTVNTQSPAVDIVHTLKSNSAQTSLFENPPHPSIENTVVPHADLHTSNNMQPKVSSEEIYIQSPIGLGHSPHSSASPTQSEGSTSINNTLTAVHSSTANISSKSHPSTSSPSSLPSSTSTFATQPVLTSSTSSFLLSFPPVPKPRTVHQVLKDSSVQNSQPLSEMITSPDSSAEMPVVHNVPPLPSSVQISSVKRTEAAPEVHDSTANNRRAHKDTENQTKFEATSEQEQCVSSQEKKLKKDDRQHCGTAEELSVTGTKLKMQSDLLITDALKKASENTQEISPTDVDSKTLMLTDSKTCSDLATVAQTEKNMTNCELANCIQPQTYFAKSHEPQKILFSKFTLQDLDVLEGTASLKAPTNGKTQSPCVFKDGVDDKIDVCAGNALSQLSKQTQVTLKQTDTHITFQEQTQTSPNTPEKPLHLDFSLAQAATSKSPTTKQKSKLAAAKSPTSDAFPSGSSTPESQKSPLNLQSYLLDVQSPMSDTSDGYFSPKEGSVFSNTSEEFYECCDSPLNELLLNSTDSHNYEKKDDRISLTNTSTSSTTTDSSPVRLNSSTTATTLSTADQNTSNTEVGLLSKTTGVMSSLLQINKQKNETKEDNNAKNKEDEIQKQESKR